MKAIKVQFKEVGKKYYFSPNNIELESDDYVVVETVRGIELGKIIGDVFDIDENDLIAELKPIIRKAREKDIKDARENRLMEPNIIERCSYYAKKNALEMKLLGCDYTLDRSKLIIYFEAEGRVDFRQLVKDLAEEFRTRIELRQVGSRDGAKYIGGLGPCGLVMCCVTHIGEFDNVSIKMAKNQNLSLNPQKISGTCGKLLCCIKFENDNYTELRRHVPSVGDIVSDKEGKTGKVLSSDVLNKRLKVKFSEDQIAFCEADQVNIVKRNTKNTEENQEELKELE